MIQGKFDSRKLFIYYKTLMARERKKGDRLIKSAAELKELYMCILREIRNSYIYNIGGVYLDNLGYLCHMIGAEQRFSLYRGRIGGEKTNGYRYRHLCYDFYPRGKYYHLYLDPMLKKRSKVRLLIGFRYRFLYREVLNLRLTNRSRGIPRIFKNTELRCKSKNL